MTTPTNTTGQTDPDVDPLADAEKIPAVSFNNAPFGTTVTGTVVEGPQLVQSRDFDTGELKTFDNGDPMWDVVVKLTVTSGNGAGEVRGLWAKKWRKPGSLFTALAEAQKAAGKRIEPGGVLTVTFTGEEPNERNPKLHPRKLYTATYEPPAPGTTGDPLGEAKASDKPPF